MCPVARAARVPGSCTPASEAFRGSAGGGARARGTPCRERGHVECPLFAHGPVGARPVGAYPAGVTLAGMLLAALPLAATSAWPPGAVAALVAAAALLSALAALLVVRRARRVRSAIARRLRRVAPRNPVVLAHGFMGFDEIRIGAASHDYFRGVRERLEREGWVVHRASVARTASVAARAEELAAFVRALPDPRVNLVAHSMGGLDARYAISRLGLGDRVASLTTIGTPHRGTPLADVGDGVLAALARVGVTVDAIHDLTTARMEAFNLAVPDARGVAYQSVVGVARRKRDVNPLLLPTFVWLADRAGPSDGVVPDWSQRWGDVLREVDADHWAQIGWSRGFDAPGFYADLLRELRGRGL